MGWWLVSWFRVRGIGTQTLAVAHTNTRLLFLIRGTMIWRHNFLHHEKWRWAAEARPQDRGNIHGLAQIARQENSELTCDIRGRINAQTSGNVEVFDGRPFTCKARAGID